MKKISPQSELDFHHDSRSFNQEILDYVSSWIRTNLEPNDIFDLDDLKSIVADECNPEDVFRPVILEEWAEENGFKRED